MNELSLYLTNSNAIDIPHSIIFNMTTQEAKDWIQDNFPEAGTSLSFCCDKHGVSISLHHPRAIASLVDCFPIYCREDDSYPFLSIGEPVPPA